MSGQQALLSFPALCLNNYLCILALITHLYSVASHPIAIASDTSQYCQHPMALPSHHTLHQLGNLTLCIQDLFQCPHDQWHLQLLLLSTCSLH